jgi:hypothetical protein
LTPSCGGLAIALTRAVVAIDRAGILAGGRVMSPYRTPTELKRHEQDEPVRDDRALGLVLLAFGGMRVAIALSEHEVFGTESTIALLMLALSLGLVVRKR